MSDTDRRAWLSQTSKSLDLTRDFRPLNAQRFTVFGCGLHNSQSARATLAMCEY